MVISYSQLNKNLLCHKFKENSQVQNILKQIPKDMKLCQERNKHKCSHDVASARDIGGNIWEKKQCDRCRIVHEPLLLQRIINQFVSVAYSFANLVSLCACIEKGTI